MSKFLIYLGRIVVVIFTMKIDSTLSSTPSSEDIPYVSELQIRMLDLSPLANEIVGNELFQRLKNVRQHGILHRIFPAAEVTRYEHCKGCGILSKSLALHLSQSSRLANKVTDVELCAVEVAGLCHDIGKEF